MHCERTKSSLNVCMKINGSEFDLHEKKITGRRAIWNHFGIVVRNTKNIQRIKQNSWGSLVHKKNPLTIQPWEKKDMPFISLAKITDRILSEMVHIFYKLKNHWTIDRKYYPVRQLINHWIRLTHNSRRKDFISNNFLPYWKIKSWTSMNWTTCTNSVFICNVHNWSYNSRRQT